MTAVTTADTPGEALEGNPVIDHHDTHLLRAVIDEMTRDLFRAHAPGHLGGLAAASDIVQVLGLSAFKADVWLEPRHLARVRAGAELLAADAFGAQRAWLLTNGSTSGNLAWLRATLRDGEEVVVARDAHASVLAGLVDSGAKPVWVSPRVHPRLGLPLGVDAAALDAVLHQHPQVRQVILSSPSYVGTCTDLSACIEVAAAHDASVYVDSAWGAHLGLHPALPISAMAAGAAGAVISLHKSSGALSGGAVLLAGPGVDAERVDESVRATQTTSPPMPTLVSLDVARRDLVVNNRDGGGHELEATIANAIWLGRQISLIPGLKVIGRVALGLPRARFDPTRVVVDVSELGCTGWAAAEVLRGEGVPVEGADHARLYLVLGSRGDASFATSAAVLAKLQVLDTLLPTTGAGGRAPVKRLRTPGVDGTWGLLAHPAEARMTPRQAHQADAVRIPTGQALGRVAAEPVVQYPPGVPAVIPGEVITEAIVAMLHAVPGAGGHLHGCADPTGATVRVVKDS